MSAPLPRGVLLLSLLALAGPASGRAPAPREAAAVAERTEDGIAALDRHDFPAAYQAFAAAYRARPAPDLLYWLGALAFAEGKLLQAQDLLRRYLDDPALPAGEDGADAPMRREARRILALPRPECGKLHVLGPRGTLVLLDGRLAGALPLSRPLLLSPGEHTVALDGGGAQGTQEARIQVPAGRFAELHQAGGAGALLLAILPGVLTSEDYGAVPAAARGPLAQAVTAAVQGEHMSSVAAAVAAGVTPPDLTDLLGQARRRELDYVLQVTAARAGAGWRFRLALVDVGVGDTAGSAERECAGCTPEQAAAALGGALPPLLVSAQGRARGTLAVRSDPPGAQVRIAGRALGRTPLEHAVWAGPAEVTVDLPGHRGERRTVAIAEGKTTTLQVELQALLPAAPVAPVAAVSSGPRPARPRWRLALGGAMAGAGLLVLGFGASGLAVAGQCVDPAAPPALVCRQIHDTTAVGAGLTGVGGALVVTGALLLALPEGRR